MSTLIKFGHNSEASLAKVGLRLPSVRGDVLVDSNSYFEPPTMVQAFLPGTLVQIGAFCSLSSMRMGGFRIGRYSAIGADVIIGANEHPTDWLTVSRVSHVRGLHNWAEFLHPGQAEDLDRKVRPFGGAAPITSIGNDVWIGQGAFIRSGVNIGDGAIVGAHSVVTRDVAPYSVVAGNPARFKRLRFDGKIVERLLRVKWWKYQIFDLFDAPLNDVERVLDFIEERSHAGELQEYLPELITPDSLNKILTADPSK